MELYQIDSEASNRPYSMASLLDTWTLELLHCNSNSHLLMINIFFADSSMRVQAMWSPSNGRYAISSFMYNRRQRINVITTIPVCSCVFRAIHTSTYFAYACTVTICIYIYIYIYVCTHICICISICMCIHMHACKFFCTRASTAASGEVGAERLSSFYHDMDMI